MNRFTRSSGLAALLALIVVCVGAFAWFRYGARSQRRSPVAAATFVGRERCQPCHAQQFVEWTGSDHDLAMDEANAQTVLADFNETSFEHGGVTTRFHYRDGKYFVETEGPGGKPREFQVTYVFGHNPLQQYLVPFPGGRLQALSVAWDVQRRSWFHLYPNQTIPADDWMHWTRAAQNWNGMCAECHSTNLRKNYDPATDTYHTTWSEIDVSCEACHGPASRHVAWAEQPPSKRPPPPGLGLAMPTRGIPPQQQVELCAPCHSRRSELGDYDHTRLALLESQLPALLDEGLYQPDGQIQDEVYEWGSFTQSKMYELGVKCSDCHNVHSLKLRRPGNDLCLQCHRADLYDRYEHHFHQQTVGGAPSSGALCVKCHMPTRAYMVIDWRADHSLRVPRPDLSETLGTRNACAQAGCHADKPLDWLVAAYRKWYGVAGKPHYGTTLAAGRAAEPSARDPLIRLAGDRLVPRIVRATALSLLRDYPGADTEAALRRGLADPDGLLRHTAADLLVESDPQQRVAALTPLLTDSLRSVRIAAASQLAGTPPQLLGPAAAQAYHAALDEYVQAMTYSLDFAASATNLGNLYVKQGDPARAESYFRRAISIDALYPPAQLSLATLLSQHGRNAEAEQLLRAVLAAFPQHAQASYMLGLLLVELGKPQEALPLLTKVAGQERNNPRASYNLGLLQQSLGRDREAEASLRRAVDLDPNGPDYLYALAEHYLRRGRLRDALPLADRLSHAVPASDPRAQMRARIEATLAAESGH